jgi:dTDP-glucose pyrophosphorylase
MTSGTSPAHWKKALVDAGSTLGEAIRNLNESALQIAMVVTGDARLLGTLTDGDIRRGLLKGLDLESPIESIIHKDPLVAPPHLGREIVLQLMRVNKIRQLPIVGNHGEVVGLHLWDELLVPELRSSTMVIMAGGRGSRLGSYTERCPKPMLPVAGKPMLEHIIERAKAEGFQRFVLAIHYLGKVIEEHFGDGGRLGVRIEYLRERAPMGTAGALALLNPRPDEAIVVSNGDVLTDVRYGELLDFHQRHEAAATMAVRIHEWQHPFGVVHTRGVDIVGFEEKPISRSHINAGIYVLDPNVLDALEQDGQCDMPALFARLQQRGLRTIVYPMHEPWLDVGRPDDYQAAQRLPLDPTR